MVNNRIDGDSGFTGLTVTDNQFPLAAADRSHRVNGLDPGLQRLIHRLALHYIRGTGFYRPGFLRIALPLAVNRPAQTINHPANQSFANRHLYNFACTLDQVAFPDSFIRVICAKDHHSHAIFFQVKHHPHNIVRELHQLTHHYIVEPINTGDRIPNLDNRSDRFGTQPGFVFFQLFFNYGGNFFGFKNHFIFLKLIHPDRDHFIPEFVQAFSYRAVNDPVADNHLHPAQQTAV